jgi:hypothetical protein
MGLLRQGIGVAVLACAVLAPAAHAAPFHSDNVSLVTKLPEAAGAASARFSPDGGTMYVSTWKGLHTYDISRPEDPQRLGFLPLPHFENEDVDAGDGIVIVSNDPNEGVGVIYVIDVSDPSMPRVRSTFRNGFIVNPESLLAPLSEAGEGATGHIANCLQGCKWLWLTGTEQGIEVVDLRDPDHPKFVGTVAMPNGKGQEEPGFTHDVFVDRSGIGWVTGQDGTFGFDAADPAHPRLVYRSDENVVNATRGGGPGTPDENTEANGDPLNFLHHNSIRTGIQLAPPPTVAASSKPTKTTTAKKKKTKTHKPRRPCAKKHGKARKRCLRKHRRAKAKSKSKRARPRTTHGGLGDVLAVTEEDYLRPGCNGQGSLQTWQILPGEKNSDGTIKLGLLDMWTTELNELQNAQGRTAADGQLPTTVNCSAHWFDEDRGLLAQGWYDQGVRFLDITNPRDIRQAGYWVTQGTFWAAYYAPTDPSRQIVYALDVTSGIDVLRIDRSASATRSIPVWQQAAIRAQRANAPAPSARWGLACPLI